MSTKQQRIAELAKQSPPMGFTSLNQASLLKELELEFKGLVTGDLAKLNEKAKTLEVPGVIVPGAGAKKP